MYGKSIFQSLHSAANLAFWKARKKIRWTRNGYRESGAENLILEREELALEKKFGLEAYKPYLSADVYRKNLWTLSLLDLEIGRAHV